MDTSDMKCVCGSLFNKDFSEHNEDCPYRKVWDKLTEVLGDPDLELEDAQA